MTATIHDLDSVRERARQRDGKFGRHHHAEATGVVIELPRSMTAAASSPDFAPSMLDVLDNAEMAEKPSSTQVAADRIPLPGYVDERLRQSVTSCVYMLRHPEGLHHGAAEVYASRLLNYLPGTDRHEIKATLAGGLDDTKAAEELIVADQGHRGIVHSWTGNGTVDPERDGVPGYRTPTVGSRYDRSATTTENAKSIRQDIKAATEAGWLPQNLAYSVRKHSHSSIGIEIKGLETDQAWDELNPDDPSNLYHQSETHSGPARELIKRLEDIAAVYQRDASDSMTDYFDVNFYANATMDAPSPSVARWRAERGG